MIELLKNGTTLKSTTKLVGIAPAVALQFLWFGHDYVDAFFFQLMGQKVRYVLELGLDSASKDYYSAYYYANAALFLLAIFAFLFSKVRIAVIINLAHSVFWIRILFLVLEAHVDLIPFLSSSSPFILALIVHLILAFNLMRSRGRKEFSPCQSDDILLDYEEYHPQN